jgi:hypothetical protein
VIIQTAWLFTWSGLVQNPAKTLHTVFVANPSEVNGRKILAQIALSFLNVRVVIPDPPVSTNGAQSLVRSYTPPFGPDIVLNDYKYNSLYVEQCIAVTFEVSSIGAMAYAVGTVFSF